MNHIEQHKEMNKEQAPKETNPADPGYQDWLTYCKAIATDAKFRGLLKAYFAGHPSEDYAALVVGALEILRGETVAGAVRCRGPLRRGRCWCVRCAVRRSLTA